MVKVVIDHHHRSCVFAGRTGDGLSAVDKFVVAKFDREQIPKPIQAVQRKKLAGKMRPRHEQHTTCLEFAEFFEQLSPLVIEFGRVWIHHDHDVVLPQFRHRPRQLADRFIALLRTTLIHRLQPTCETDRLIAQQQSLNLLVIPIRQPRHQQHFYFFVNDLKF